MAQLSTSMSNIRPAELSSDDLDNANGGRPQWVA
jgi:hypothetical protein